MKKLALLLICTCLSSCSVYMLHPAPIYENVCRQYSLALKNGERGFRYIKGRVGNNGELYFALETEGDYTVDEARAILITEVQDVFKLFIANDIQSSIYNFQDVVDSLNFSISFILKDSCEHSGLIVRYVSLYNACIRYFEGDSLCLDDLKQMHRETFDDARIRVMREASAKKKGLK